LATRDLGRGDGTDALFWGSLTTRDLGREGGVPWKQGTLEEKSEEGDGWGWVVGRKKIENLTLIVAKIGLSDPITSNLVLSDCNL
jgi:hypothetical protein